MPTKAPCFIAPLLLVGVPLAAKNAPNLAAFAGLKTPAHHVILSLGQNIRSIFAHTHNERTFEHDRQPKNFSLSEP
jgi:hypothetical protein